MKKENLTIQYYYDPEEKDKDIKGIFQHDDDLVEKYQKEYCAICWTLNPQIDKNKRGIENTSHYQRLGLDIDIAKEKNNIDENERISRKKNIYKKILNLPLKPTFIIETKNGYQPIWEFSDPYEIKSASEAKLINKQYKQIIKAFTKKTGLTSEADSITRVFRLPGTYHFKDKNNPFEIKVVYRGEKTTRQTFLDIYDLIKEIEKNETTNNDYVIDKEHFDRIARDYGWLTDTLINLDEGGYWYWRNSEGSGRNNLLKSVVASVFAVFKNNNWTDEAAANLCLYIHSQMDNPIPLEEIKIMIEHKKDWVESKYSPDLDIKIDENHLHKKKKNKLPVVLPVGGLQTTIKNNIEKTTVEKAEAIFGVKAHKASDEVKQADRIARSKGWISWRIENKDGIRKVVKA